jgi:hypothetical protein
MTAHGCAALPLRYNSTTPILLQPLFICTLAHQSETGHVLHLLFQSEDNPSNFHSHPLTVSQNAEPTSASRGHGIFALFLRVLKTFCVL